LSQKADAEQACQREVFKSGSSKATPTHSRGDAISILWGFAAHSVKLRKAARKSQGPGLVT